MYYHENYLSLMRDELYCLSPWRSMACGIMLNTTIQKLLTLVDHTYYTLYWKFRTWEIHLWRFLDLWRRWEQFTGLCFVLKYGQCLLSAKFFLLSNRFVTYGNTWHDDLHISFWSSFFPSFLSASDAVCDA